MDIRTRDGNMRETEGASVRVRLGPNSLFMAIEGRIRRPVWRDQLFVECEHSYLEQSSSLFYPYISDGRLPFGFTDAYGKLTFGGGTVRS